MLMQFDTFRKQWLESVLDSLWARLSSLGAAGHATNGGGSIVEDPEDLILSCLYFGRWDARMFDELLSWLIKNAHSINLKRLESLQKSYPAVVEKLLSAVSRKVVLVDSRWSKLLKDFSGEESCFFIQMNTPVAVGKAQDPDFFASGMVRAPYKNRQLARSFPVTQPAALVLRLRALLGMNTNVEVLGYLADGRMAHASFLAKQLGYSQKAIQETLSRMETGEGVSSVVDGRKKLFRLNLGCWAGLLPCGVAWRDSTVSFSFLTHCWEVVWPIDIESSLMLASELRHGTEKVDNLFPQMRESRLEACVGEQYTFLWVKWLQQHIDELK